MPQPAVEAGVTAERRRVLTVVATVGLLSLPALVDPGGVARAVALAGGGAWPQAPGALGWALLYLWVPVLAVSSLALVLGPGLLLALAIGAARTVSQWLLLGLALATVGVSLVVEAFEAVAGAPLLGRGFAAEALALSVAAGLVAIVRAGRGGVAVPREGSGPVVAAGLALVVALLVGLLPKFLWESFNGDGAHAHEAARLLLFQAVPFWPAGAGNVGNYPGVATFLASYPTAWFLRLFGEVEAASRLPYLLFLGAGLYPALLAAIEVARSERLRPSVPWLVALGLAVFSVVMAYSATYNPYHADIALPATQDALVLAWFLGFAVAFVERRPAALAGFGALSYFTSPAGLVLLGFWIIAAFLFLPGHRRGWVLGGLGVVAACVLLGRLAPGMLAALGLPQPGLEHSTGGLAKRFLDLQWRQWRRVLFVVIPGGIVPALSLLLWRRLDPVARTLAAVTAAQFALFYVQRRSSLHYFAPAMVLPIAVCWRTLPAAGRRWVVPAAAAAAVLALIGSVPRAAGAHTAARAVGTRLEDRLGGYDEGDPRVFRRSELLSRLFFRDSHRAVPDSGYGGSPLSWIYYAHRARAGRAAYVLQAEADPAPIGGRLIAAADSAALYVVDDAAYEQDRTARYPRHIAAVYQLPKQTLFAR